MKNEMIENTMTLPTYSFFFFESITSQKYFAPVQRRKDRIGEYVGSIEIIPAGIHRDLFSAKKLF